jgi:RsiW-degrading membrane proteinase PrsW (M82 family)
VGIRFHDFDESLDGIIYASFVALGFGPYENFLYVEYVQGAEAFARGLASPLVQIMFASIWGYRCTEARTQRDGVARAVLTALALAAFLHRLYDFVMIGLPPWYRPLSACPILAVWVWRMRLYRRLTDRSSVRTRTARTLARDVAGEHARTPCEIDGDGQ